MVRFMAGARDFGPPQNLKMNLRPTLVCAVGTRGSFPRETGPQSEADRSPLCEEGVELCLCSSRCL